MGVLGVAYQRYALDSDSRWVLGCWSFTLAVSLACLTYSIISASEVDDTDPEADFSATVCEITDIKYITAIRMQEGSGNTRRNTCNDKYMYTFTNDGKQYDSCDSILERIVSRDCDGPADEYVRDPLYLLASRYQCWRPTKMPVPSAYRCCNSECVKLVDPASEMAAKEESSSTLLIIGIVFLGLAVIGFSVQIYMCHTMNWCRENEAPTGGDQENQTCDFDEDKE